MSLQSIKPDEIRDNLIGKIRDQWMLVAAGTEGKANSMLASWGFTGEMWFKDVAMCVVRPQRYTREFLDDNETYSLSFYPENYRDVLKTFGSKSGRDINKVEGGALTPAYKHGTLYYEEAELVIFCKKLYVQSLEEDCFIDKSLVDSCYKNRDFHKAYYGEILEVLA